MYNVREHETCPLDTARMMRTAAMKIQYDPQTDTLTIRLRDERIKESEEVRPGVTRSALIAAYG